MSKKLYIQIAIISVINLLIFITFFLFLNNRSFESLKIDLIFRDFAYDFRGDKYNFLYWFFRLITELGYLYVIVFIVLFVGLKYKGDIKSFILGIGAIFTYLLNTLIKLCIMRERPIEENRWMNEHSSSFPSGHSMNSMFLYYMIAYFIFKSNLERKNKIIFYVLCGFIVLLVGFSRIVLGVHYFSDVICGYALGIICAQIFILIYELCVKKGFNFINNFFNKKEEVNG